jgi:polyhydroxybutyrate depolymerase
VGGPGRAPRPSLATMRKALLVLAIMVTTVLAGCGWHRPDASPTDTATAPTASSSASAVPVGTSWITIEADGQARSFAVHRPLSAAPTAGYPLVVMLHGGLGSAAQAEAAYGWDALADREGFVVVYPNGLDRTWNAGSCCGSAERNQVNDVGFLTQLVTELSTRIPLDPARRFVTGMSNGAMMAYRLACQTNLFAAVAPVAGTQLIDCSNATPLSVLHLHGAADPTVRLDGRRGSGPAQVSGPPLASVWAGWRLRDNCTDFAVSRSAGVTTAIASCPSHRNVEWIVVATGGHEWPGGVSSKNPGKLDATALIWSFFAAHPRL